MQAELIVLRIVHVVGAIVWAGTAFFVAFFLMPSLRAAGPAAGPVMGELLKRRLFTIVPTVAVFTMLAGLRLLWIVSTGFSRDFFLSRSGHAYALGALCAISAFTVFILVSHPAIGRSMQLGAQMAQAPESERAALMSQLNAVRARSGKATLATAILLMIAAIAMSVGRYL